MSQPLDDDLLKILVCPKCRGDLELDSNAPALICRACRLVYEIRDGIPIMLVDEAASLQDEDSVHDG